MTVIDDTAVTRRWTRRLKIRKNLLARAEKALEQARSPEERKLARRRVERRKDQVGFAQRVLDRRETPKLTARERAVRAAMLGVKHRDQINYTQQAPRWEGIRKQYRAHKGEFPRNADCSSFVTWCLWDALGGPKAGADVVNGASWTAGYTGTQVTHGKRVNAPAPGDLILYAGGAIPPHVAIYVGDGKVVSHGSQPGPMVLAWNYRPVAQIRRYLPS